MAPRALFGDAFAQTVDLWRAEHAMFAFHFALAEPPKYRLVSGGTISSCEAAVLQRPESIFGLNYDEARGELQNIEDMPLQIVTPSVADPSRVPTGMATLKIEGTLPYALKGGPQQWDAMKEQVADTLLTTYMKLTTNITKEKVLARALFSPLDIERMNPAMWRGSAHHGDRRFNQLVGNRTPIPGLYQTGACTAPGGSITGMAGRNAAAVILQDAGTSIEAVVGKGRTV
jgi:phytoene dehydrogenase-like protein